ncbi:MAG: hypothetical protein LW854_18785 [Rubrivivax sp.]|nr:hypothetical protein [Rubrivivax sp.]
MSSLFKRLGRHGTPAGLWRCLVGLALLALMSACAAPPATPPMTVLDALLDDQAFLATRTDPPGAAEVFRRSAAMERFVSDVLWPKARREGGFRALLSVLNEPELLGMRYSDDITLTASQSFEARAGNCLSLALVAAALAEQLGLEVEFQRLAAPDVAQPALTSVSAYLPMVGHVNLRLAERVGTRVVQTATFDFLAPTGGVPPRAVPIDRSRVLALFYNNRAVELLMGGDGGQAYWWARASVLQDPAYAGGFITLGALWHQLGRHEQAQLAYEAALLRDPRNTNAAANLAGLVTSAPGVSPRPAE